MRPSLVAYGNDIDRKIYDVYHLSTTAVVSDGSPWIVAECCHSTIRTPVRRSYWSRPDELPTYSDGHRLHADIVINNDNNIVIHFITKTF